MQRRSQGPPEYSLNLEIDRTLRGVRNLYQELGEFEQDPLDTSSTSTGSMGDENPVPLFRDFGAPENYELTSGIRLPTTNTNFTIHPHYTNMVLQNQFTGMAHEDPIEHLNRFLELCAMVQTNQVTQDYIRMHLFRHSLSGRAYRWLKNLKPQSLTTWSEVASAFLKKFISEEKTAEKRRKIAMFQQEDGESLSEAWERFNEYVRACPNHEYSKNQLIRTFYDGLDPIPKSHLNAACGGQISKVPQAELEDKIEEVMRACAWGGQSRATTKKPEKYDLDPEQLKAFMEQIVEKKMGKSQAASTSTPSTKAPVFSCEQCGGTNHDASYCGGRDFHPEQVAAMGYQYNQRDFRDNVRGNQRPYEQGGQSNYTNNNSNQGGYYNHPNHPNRQPFNKPPFNQNFNPPQNHPNPPFPNPSMPHHAPTQDTQLILDKFKNLQREMSGFQKELGQQSTQIKEINSHQKMTDTQIAQLADKVAQLSNDKLPGQPSPNPASHSVNAIHLRSGTAYDGPTVEQQINEEAPQSEEGKEVEEEVMVDSSNAKGGNDGQEMGVTKARRRIGGEK